MEMVFFVLYCKRKIKVDIASKKGDHIGPVVSKVQYDKIIKLIKDGIKEGATLAAGGPELPEGLNKGYFIKHATKEIKISKTHYNLQKKQKKRWKTFRQKTKKFCKKQDLKVMQ